MRERRSLPVIQNLLKRDPSAYAEEFDALWRQYLSEMQVLKESTSLETESQQHKRLGELALFVAHCGSSFSEAKERFGPELADLLSTRSLPPSLRLSLTQACVLARSKGLFEREPVRVLHLCFELVQISDKALRRLCRDYLLADAKKARGEYAKECRKTITLKLRDERDRAARCAMEVLMMLYKRRIWTDKAIVNALARSCVDERSKLARTAAAFFLGRDDAAAASADSDDDSDDEGAASESRQLQAAREAASAHQHSKKTKKRLAVAAKQAKKASKLAKRIAERKAPGGSTSGAAPLFSAIDLLDDPMSLCEKLLTRLRAQKDSFETRNVFSDLVSRVVATHKLQILPFYAYLARYFTAHQRDVTKLLAIFAQACHDLVPPDHVLPVVRRIADNFVSDRNAPEAIALGINSIREITNRVPSLLDEPDMLGFARDLAAYSKHRDKSVVVAARAWINAVRIRFPLLLRKKDRGRNHLVKLTPFKFGAEKASEQVDGAHLLAAYEQGNLPEDFEDAVRDCDDLNDQGEDGEKEEDEEEEVEEEEEDEEEEEEEEVEDDEPDMEEDEEEEEEDEEEEGEEDEEEEEQQREQLSSLDPRRILSDTDFERIRLLKARAAELNMLPAQSEGRVSASDIEAFAVKRRASVEERRAKVVQGREKFQHKMHAGGKTNAEKVRTKNYLMLQKKAQRSGANRKRRMGGPPKQQDKRDKRKRRRL